MLPLTLRGDVVERQSFLNGTRYYLIEGDDGTEGWRFTLALTLPREASEPLSEGDLSLVGAGASWFGDIVDGTYEDRFDERIDATILGVAVLLRQNPDAGGEIRCPRLRVEIRILVDECELDLRPEP